MKQRFFIIAFLLGFFFITSKAQEPAEVVVSQQKITENGMTFWLHTVEAGQTLYRISLAYKVPISDILQYNPEAAKVLKTGQQLKIPATPSEISPYTNIDFIYHVTKAGETLQSISNIYSVPIETIQKLNPGIGKDKLP
ncbi:MAG TPA: LysM peptidoglycan-binding domain-containing protein, partial [Bacteroidales bacterium]|nr:LysM peptidoglycan-binding domain-containing protein [Bacteroidales bacterium]